MTLPGFGSGQVIINGQTPLAAGGPVADDIDANVTGISIDLELDQASTLEIDLDDPHRKVIQSGLLSSKATCHVDDVPFRLAAVDKKGTKITLTFEHAVTAALRTHTSPRASTQGMTRVDFAKLLVAEEPWITVVVPPGVTEPPASEVLTRGSANQAAQTAATPDAPPAPSYLWKVAKAGGNAAADNTSLVDLSALGLGETSADTGADSTDPTSTVVGQATDTPDVPVTPTPLPTSGSMTVDQAAQAAYQAGFRNDALATIVAIGGPESGYQIDAVSPPNRDGTTDRGWLQINSIHTQYDFARLISDPIYCAQAAWDISSQGTNFKPWTTFNTGAYQPFLAAATAAADNLTGQVATAGPGSDANTAPESTWDCLVRIFNEVQWRVFARNANELWLAPDSALFAQGADLTLSPDAPGVDDIDFSWDSGQLTATATTTLRAGLWGLWNGQSAELNGIGPASGIWLVQSVKRDLSGPNAEISFVQPRPQLPEPAVQPGGDDTGTGDTADSGGSGVTKLAKQSLIDLLDYAFSKVGDAYVFGATGPDSFDCSGYVSAAAVSAGQSAIPRNSNAIFNWCSDASTLKSVADAINIPGALLFELSDPTISYQAGKKPKTPVTSEGHIVISLGNGEDVEAMNPSAGVLISGSYGRFQIGALIPGFDYSPAAIAAAKKLVASKEAKGATKV